MTVLCACVAETTVVDICDLSFAHHQQLQRGYLRTSFYPQPYSNSVDCVRNLTSRIIGDGQIRLFVVDLQLETSGGVGCADWLRVFDGLKDVTLCGRRARRRLATSAWQWLQVRFHSDRQHRRKGFWLYYDGTQIITIIFVEKFGKRLLRGRSIG